MRSMTGQGRGECTREGVRAVVELRAVNRRQAEIVLQMPEELAPLEARVRDAVGAVVSRGRCEVRLQLELPGGGGGGRVNQRVAQAYAEELRRLAGVLGIGDGVTLEMLIRCPGVLETGGGGGDAEPLWPVVQEALRWGLAGLDQMRRREGEVLAQDLGERVRNLKESVARVRERAPQVLERYRENLLQRVRAAGLEGVGLEDERLLKEVVLFADRSDIAEELARLESHFLQFEECCRSREAVGRTLDFLAQEMNREINTIGSKANDAGISTEVVRLKTELERFREQAQNVE